MNYYSKTASKSFDELDDILTSEKKAQESTTTTTAVQPTTASSVMMKNSPSSSMMDEASASSAASRHSCDELMMTRSLYEAETSDDAGSQVINIRPQMLSRGLSSHLLYPFGTSIDKRGQKCHQRLPCILKVYNLNGCQSLDQEQMSGLSDLISLTNSFQNGKRKDL